MNNLFNVRDFGTAGDGRADDSPAIQRALDAAEETAGTVYIPAGTYRIGKTLYVGNDTTIRCDSAARLFHCERQPKRRGDFLLSNRDPAGGNRNIALFRETLYERVWENEYMGDSRTVDLHVQRLRKKLHWEDKIKAIYKVGYRLEA